MRWTSTPLKGKRWVRLTPIKRRLLRVKERISTHLKAVAVRVFSMAIAAIVRLGDTSELIAENERLILPNTAKERMARVRIPLGKEMEEKEREHGSGHTPRRVSGKEDGNKKVTKEKDSR